MNAIKEGIINKAVSMLSGAVLGKLSICREGPDNDLVVSLEIEVSLGEAGPTGAAASVGL
jgi:hypothetical protein